MLYSPVWAKPTVELVSRPGPIGVGRAFTVCTRSKSGAGEADIRSGSLRQTSHRKHYSARAPGVSSRPSSIKTLTHWEVLRGHCRPFVMQTMQKRKGGSGRGG